MALRSTFTVKLMSNNASTASIYSEAESSGQNVYDEVQDDRQSDLMNSQDNVLDVDAVLQEFDVTQRFLIGREAV